LNRDSAASARRSFQKQQLSGRKGNIVRHRASVVRRVKREAELRSRHTDHGKFPALCPTSCTCSAAKQTFLFAKQTCLKHPPSEFGNQLANWTRGLAFCVWIWIWIITIIWGPCAITVEMGGMGFGNGVGCLCVQPDAGTLHRGADAMRCDEVSC